MPLGSNAPFRHNPRLELLGGYIRVFARTGFFQVALAKHLDKLPSVLHIRARWAFPTAVGTHFAVVVVLLPQDFALPNHLFLNEKVAYNMMRGNVIRIKWLYVNNKSTAVFQYTNTLAENAKKHIEVLVPICRVIVVVVVKSEVVRRRCENYIDAVVGELFQELKTVRANYTILKL